MSEIKIKNCNNIKNGELILEKDKLNIKYGMNGTGKSTLSTALRLFSEGKALDELKTFGSSENEIPEITIDSAINNVMVFDEMFVDNIVFKENSLIQNAFDVFIKTPDYESKRKELDDRLIKLKVDIKQEEKIIELKKAFYELSGKLELNAARTNIKLNTNYKAILKKENLFNVPKKLEKYTPILHDDNLCINWIDWKTKGVQFDEKGICPYCSDELKEEYEEEKKVFTDTYKKADAQNLKNMLDIFEKIKIYLIEDKYGILISCIKEEKEESAIQAVLMAFLNEYNHISQQLIAIDNFDTSIFKQIDIAEIDKILENMKIETTILNFFKSELMDEIVILINNKLDELCKEALDIKASMGKLQSSLKKAIQLSQDDINYFLDSAGIEYKMEINLEESGTALAVLKYKKDGDLITVDKIRNHLSWGERNAFALILFMFFSLSQNAELVVLDDPISSFDMNKKYAIIHRMFSKQSGALPRSFYKKTVLMLTHDFEPVIDFIVVGKLPREVVNAMFIKNVNGVVTEKIIDNKTDIRPVVEELKRHIKNNTLCMVNRITFLRKYYEHNGVDEYIDAYNVLSSLIHGRAEYKYLNGSSMLATEVQNGENEIRNLIPEFDYVLLISTVFNETQLVKLYFAESNNYLKVQIFRALFEVKEIPELSAENILVKFINESYHIENDYAYYLDMIRFEMVPTYIVKAIDEFMIRTYN